MGPAQARDVRQCFYRNLPVQVFVNVVQNALQSLRVHDCWRAFLFLAARQRIDQEKTQGRAEMSDAIRVISGLRMATGLNEEPDCVHDAAIVPRQFPQRTVLHLVQCPFLSKRMPSGCLVFRAKAKQQRLLFPMEDIAGLFVYKNYILPASGDGAAPTAFFVPPVNPRFGFYLRHHNKPVSFADFFMQTLGGQ